VFSCVTLAIRYYCLSHDSFSVCGNWVTLFEYDMDVLRKFLLLIGCYSSVNIKWGHTNIAVPVHTMKAYSGVEVELHSFLNLALDGSQCSASCPGLFTPPTGLQSWSQCFWQEQICCPFQESNHDSLDFQSIVNWGHTL